MNARTGVVGTLLCLLAAACGDTRTLAPTPTPIVSSPAVVLVVFDGNSLSQSRGGVPPYPTFIDLHTTPSMNVAVGGATTVDQDRLATTTIDPFVRAGGTNLVVLWEGTNDLYFGATADDAARHLATYVEHRHGAGFMVLLGTTLSRSDVGLSANYEARRQALNAQIRAGLGADGVIDLAADPIMGAQGAELNPQYFLPDHVHLAQDGAERIATMVGSALDRWIGRTDRP